MFRRHLSWRPGHPLPTSTWYIPPTPPSTLSALETNARRPLVWVKRGICSADSIINILLLVLGYIPGLIHAWYIIAKFPDADYEYEALPRQDAEGGRVRYIIIDRTNDNSNAKPQQGPNYGTQGGRNNQYRSQAPASSSAAPQQQGIMNANGGEGSSDGQVPPSYADVVAGDNKIQTRD